MAEKRKRRKKRDWRKIFMACMAGLLALVMVLSVILSALPLALAVQQSEIDALKAQSSGLAQEKAELQNQLSAIQDDKNEAMAQKTLLEQQINVIQSEIATTTALIEEYTLQIGEKEVELAEAEQAEAEYYELFCQRVRAMEENGTVSYWEIIFEAADYSDLLDRLDVVSRIMNYSNYVVEQLGIAKQQVAEAKADLESAKGEQEAAKAELDSQKAELVTQEAKVDVLLSQLQADEDAAQEAIDDLEAQAAAMDKEIAALEEELRRQNIKITSEAGYLWPLPGYTNLSSLYAGRIDPFTGKPAVHNGIDVPAPKGTEILAAKSGVVITSGYNTGGYGNYVVVSHGNGDSTLYAHMSSRAVSVGDTVTKGQVLGYVGTTGRSTGNHLHFEVRVSSGRIDPVTCFSGLTYKGTAL